MDKKFVVIIILVLVLIVLAGFTSYLYSGITKCKEGVTQCQTTAVSLGTQLQQCAVGIEACQDAFTALGNIPACAPYLPSQ